MVSAVIVAAGRGSRMGAGYNKVFMPLAGRPVLAHTIAVFAACEEISEIIVVMSGEEIARGRKILADYPAVKFAEGGAMRADSVRNGVLLAKGTYIAVHDGARPLILPETLCETIREAKKNRAAAVGVICKDTIKQLDEDGFFRKTLDREHMLQIQTPQVFERKLLAEAYEAFPQEKPTDECGYIERLGVPIKTVLGSYENLKLTTPEDLAIAEEILRRRKNENRTGI